MAAPTIEQISAWFQRAKQKSSARDNLYRDAYRYAVPNRDMMDQANEGQDNTPEIFDSTAVDSTFNFANFLHDGFTPPEYRWGGFACGPEIQPMMRERVQALLDGVSEMFFYLLNNTNFDTEINQCYYDVAVGTGVLGIRDYGKFGSDEAPATFVATPPYQIYTMDGREGHVCGVFREFDLEPYRIKILWPDAKFDDSRTQFNISSADMKLKVVEAVWYDYEDKVYYYRVFLNGGVGSRKEYIVQDTNRYANWLVFRWSVVSGEQFGRGPLINALADIKTANRTVELILSNASIDLAGIYTAVDDGVLNPSTVELTPATIIPVGSNGGNLGPSLKLLERSGNFDVSELVLRDLRQSIRRKLLDDDLAPLDDAVRSSREAALRFQEARNRAGPSIGRLRTELAVRLMKELTTLWQSKGLLPPFEIDGKNITLRFTSPLGQAQNDDDLQQLDTYVARLNAFQQGMAPIVIKPEEYAHYVAEKSKIPLKLINGRDALIQAQQIMGAKIAEGGPEAQEIVEGFTG